MAATYITDHTDRIKLLLPEQFKASANVVRAIQIFAAKLQEVEDVAFDLLTDRALDVAVGQQLDNIGDIVGELRYARADAEYRLALKVRIKINVSSGTPDQVIEIVKLSTNATDVVYSELYPATVSLIAGGVGVTASPTLAAMVQSVLPATVSFFLTVVDPDSFRFDAGAGGSGKPYADVGFTVGAGKYVEALT